MLDPQWPADRWRRFCNVWMPESPESLQDETLNFIGWLLEYQMQPVGLIGYRLPWTCALAVYGACI